MKKQFAIILAALLSASIFFAACDQASKTPPEIGSPVADDANGQTSEEEKGTVSDAANPDQPAADKETPSEDKPIIKPGGSDTPTSSKPDPKPESKPDPKPEQKPDPKPEEKPALSANDIWASVKDSMGEVSSLSDMNSETLSDLYGVSSSDLVSFVGKMPLMNVKATEIFIAEVKDGKMDAVKTGIKNRQADLAAQWEHYLPDQYEIVQNYKLVTSGNYVLFVVSENASSVVSAFQKSVG